MPRIAEEIAQAHKACLDGARNIDRVIATHAKGNDAVSSDFGSDMTHDEKTFVLNLMVMLICFLLMVVMIGY
jgi:uncharacterized membrane protein